MTGTVPVHVLLATLTSYPSDGCAILGNGLTSLPGTAIAIASTPHGALRWAFVRVSLLTHQGRSDQALDPNAVTLVT